MRLTQSLWLVLCATALMGCPRPPPRVPETRRRAAAPPEGRVARSSGPDGPVVAYYDAARTLKHYAGRRLNGRRHGTWTWWHRTGKKSMVATYVHGRYHGPIRRWHEDGRVHMQGQYDKDRKVGTWEHYSKDGARRKTCRYAADGSRRCKSTFHFKDDVVESNCHPVPRRRVKKRGAARSGSPDSRRRVPTP